ncbi:MAG: glycosyltransferase, partial [Planctomycetes bacterium]|nr:glycosyltransferase [Planctomycetota bacterium]
MRLAVSFPGCYRRGGVERVVLETANHFAGRDHDVHLFASEVDDRAIDPRVTVHAVDYGPRTT